MFERSPGTCPFTGRELVPVTSTEGYAETALRLTGTDPYVDLGDPAALRFAGKPYSIEAWVKPASAAGPVLGRSGEYRFGVSANGAVTFSHSGSPTVVVSTETVPTDTYTHIAATFDGTTAKLCVNGQEAGSGALPFTPAAGVHTLAGSNGAGDHFDGDLDELRIWNRARSRTELTEDMNHRLIGNEPGLVADYRFDEGAGTTAYDQTDNALHGKLPGDGQWTGSDAPVGDHPGVRRDNFTLKGRTVESGMSAVLYHQQENVVAGCRADPKPAKRQARVMLAFAAKDGQDPYLATLDFAVAAPAGWPRRRTCWTRRCSSGRRRGRTRSGSAPCSRRSSRRYDSDMIDAEWAVVRDDGESLAVAEPAAAHELGDEVEGLVTGLAYAPDLDRGRDDRALRGVLERGASVERVLRVEAEAVGVEQDRLLLVESVGLGGQADAVALHGPDEAVDDLVAEGGHPPTAERRAEVLFQQGVEVPPRTGRPGGTWREQP
ncbi:LamG domain-containing protein [Kitasatospora sp. NPDC101155]|uniref:LamG domain-containing protein n=1 Tax=Kitasatospora sp. NPDC101155 TaxID=3364097 RepID=UPI00381419F8